MVAEPGHPKTGCNPPTPNAGLKTRLPERRHALVILLALSGFLAIRIPVILGEAKFSPDSIRRYDRIARNLLDGHGFSRGTSVPYEPDTFDQPGYPLFLAATYSVSSGNPQAVIVLQALLEATTVVLVGLTSVALGLRRREQALAVGLAAACPVLPFYAGLVLTEVLTTFLVALGLFLAARALMQGANTSLGLWALIGVAWGSALLVRADTVLVFLLVGLTGLTLLVGQRRCRAFPYAAVAGVALLLTLAPWAARNWTHTRSLMPLGGASTQLRTGYVQWLDTWVDHPRLLDPYWWSALDPQSFTTFPAEATADRGERALAAEALHGMRDAQSLEGAHSATFERLAADARTRRPFETRLVVPASRTVASWLMVPHYVRSPRSRHLWYFVWAVFLLLTLIGSVRCVLAPGPRLILLAALAGRSVLPLISALGSEPRYQLAALPAAFVLAALGMDQLWQRSRSLGRAWTRRSLGPPRRVQLGPSHGGPHLDRASDHRDHKSDPEAPE